MPTLEEIARLAGVSRSTVSRVVNNDPKVNAVTRQRILDVIKSINFQPNAAARSLAGGKTRILGLVIPRGVAAIFTDPYFPLLVQGVSSACNAHDYSVMLWLDEPDYERRTVRKILNNELLDGVILASTFLEDPLLDALAEKKLPFVLIGRHPSYLNASYIDVDNVNGAFQIVSHLIRLGYRRIAAITGQASMVVTMDRLEGYKSALKGAGLAVDHDLIVESDFSEDGGYLSMQRLIPRHPDAVFAASDALAAGALRALRDARLRVPDDISVVGFDDMPFAAHTDPPLTTVRQPINRVGSLAVETLIDLVENPDTPPRRIIFPTELVIRNSCGTVQAPQTAREA